MTTPSPQLIAAPFTPFGADGELALDAIPDTAAGLVTDGVDGAFVCGTTGECGSLTLGERQRVAAAWADADGPDVIVHVGHSCLADARELAAHAESLGVSAIAAVAPYYQRPATIDDLVECCARIAAAAPAMPFLYYHIPSVTGVWLPMDEFFTAASERIATFAGIKYTHDDLGELGRLLELATAERPVLFGRDEILLSALALGATGAVGSTYNFAAPLYRAVAAGLATGDLGAARRAQRAATEMIETAVRYGGQPALKALAARLGRASGPCRLPLRSLADDRADALVAELDDAGFFSALDTAR